MIAELSSDTPVLVQGISGRMGRAHAALMRAYGTNIVAGVAARAGIGTVDGVPVFQDCASAVAATGALAALAMVPPEGTRKAVEDALAGGIRLIVTVAEGIPVHDALAIGRMTRAAGALWIGPSTPGLAVPGRMKIGFLPDVSLNPGRFALMSKSGTLSYEVGYRLAQEGLGQSLWVGVGGDPVKGVRFPDLLPVFEAHAGTDAIIVIGEVGGTEEEDLAAAMLRLRPQKPVHVIIAGREAKEGIAMGHAGALIYGEAGTLDSKRTRLLAAGARVWDTIDGLIGGCMAAR